MKKKQRTIKKEEKFQVCVVCGANTKAPKGTQCCGRKMLTKDKAWTD